MKRKTKLGLLISGLSIGVLAISGCTASFCSDKDQSNMLAAFDNGVTAYYSESNKPENAIQHEEYHNIWYTVDYKNNYGALNDINKTCNDSNIEIPDIFYWRAFDLAFLRENVTNHDISAEELNVELENKNYLRFYTKYEEGALFDNWNYYNQKAVDIVTKEAHKSLSYCPSNDYIQQYKKSMKGFISNVRACIATTDGQYGSYGPTRDNKKTVAIEAKSYGYSWSRGFLEGLLIWPIAAFVDSLCAGLQPLGNGLNGTTGWAQLLAIVIVTIVVRAVMFAISFKSTINTAKMTELQPEITKIQNKYPNANSNQSEKARMSEEMQKLYKKNKVNPFSSLLIMIVQFPVFICVWGALSGSAWLSTGSFLNLNLSDSISSALFNGANWVNGSAVTALVLFLLMAGAQVVSMLLPQWMQKARAKKVAKLGVNPTQKQQNNRMKWVTYIMMIMIIFMGFSLASAMGVYWLIGALFSIAQTLITQKIINRKKEK